MVLLAGVPVVLALLAALEPHLLGPMLGFDGLLVVVAALDALLARRRLVEVERRAPRVFSVGRANHVTLELRSRSLRRLRLRITDDLPAFCDSPDLPMTLTLAPRGRAEVRYRARPARRGEHALGDHHLRYPSPLGLWLRQQHVPARATVKVYPDVEAVRAYEMLAREQRESALVRAVRRPGGESEFEQLREYRKDDEFRSIDWRATARRQRLIARQYQLERNQTIMFVLDCGRLMTAEAEGLSRLDHALNATLMMSHVATRTGDHVSMLAFADRVRAYVSPTGGPQASRTMMQACYDLHPELVESNLDEAFDALSLRLRKRALVVVFTDVVDEVSAAALLRRVRRLHPRHLPLCVLFRDTELDSLLDGAGGDAPLDLYVRAAAAELQSWRDRLIRQLKAGGALVLDVPPRQMTPSLVERYLEIKSRQLL